MFIFFPRGRAARNHHAKEALCGSDGKAAMAARSFIPDLHWTSNWVQLGRPHSERLSGGCLSPDCKEGSRANVSLDQEPSLGLCGEV